MLFIYLKMKEQKNAWSLNTYLQRETPYAIGLLEITVLVQI
jgi:hypothetical protein